VRSILAFSLQYVRSKLVSATNVYRKMQILRSFSVSHIISKGITVSVSP